VLLEPVYSLLTRPGGLLGLFHEVTKLLLPKEFKKGRFY
jgi:hypothetical protein